VHDKDYRSVVFEIDDKTHRIIGTTFSSNQKAKGNEDLIRWLSRLLEPRINFNFHEFEVEGKNIVIVRIKATQNIPIKFKGIRYIRIGSSKKKLVDYPEKERSIWTKSPIKSFENEIAVCNLKPDEVLKLIDYSSYFELTNSSLPGNRNAIFEKFLQERRISKAGKNYNITNLCAILFARKLDEFESLERKAIRVIVYQGKNKLRTKREQLGQKGYASGFKGLVNYINDQLPSNEEIGKAFRKEVKMYPELAIRELVANAIIHQDFSETGTSPMIEIFEDRVEITNPGKPLISTLRFVDHNPQSRNEKLAHFMRRISICEERGSGIDKVIFECEYFHQPQNLLKGIIILV
jgi:predicted HTH transcriptional regulator